MSMVLSMTTEPSAAGTKPSRPMGSILRPVRSMMRAPGAIQMPPPSDSGTGAVAFVLVSSAIVSSAPFDCRCKRCAAKYTARHAHTRSVIWRSHASTTRPPIPKTPDVTLPARYSPSRSIAATSSCLEVTPALA